MSVELLKGTPDVVAAAVLVGVTEIPRAFRAEVKTFDKSVFRAEVDELPVRRESKLFKFGAEAAAAVEAGFVPVPVTAEAAAPVAEAPAEPSGVLPPNGIVRETPGNKLNVVPFVAGFVADAEGLAAVGAPPKLIVTPGISVMVLAAALLDVAVEEALLLDELLLDVLVPVTAEIADVITLLKSELEDDVDAEAAAGETTDSCKRHMAIKRRTNFIPAPSLHLHSAS